MALNPRTASLNFVSFLFQKDNRCTLMMSLAETSICKDNDWDPEDPRCAHIVMTGTFHQVAKDSAEYPTAEDAVFERHPDFRHLPENHHFFVAKFNVLSISIQDTFGGPRVVSVKDYFNVADYRFGLFAYYTKYF